MHAYQHQQCPARLRSRALGPLLCAPATGSVVSRPARLRHSAVTAAVASIRPQQQAAAAHAGKRVRKQEQPVQLPEDYGDLPDQERQLLEAQALAEGLEAVYHAKARQVKRMLTPERVQQLQQELSEEDLEALQVILDDIQGLVEADAPGQTQEQLDAAAAAAEAALMQQLESGPPPIPPDFNSYVLQAMPPGTTLEQVAQQLAVLPPQVLAELQQLYEELKAFSTSSLASSTAAATYLDLSERMGSMATKLEQWDTGHPTTSSSSSSSGNSSRSSSSRSSSSGRTPGTSVNSSSSTGQPEAGASSVVPPEQQQPAAVSRVASRVSRVAGTTTTTTTSSSSSSSSTNDVGGVPRGRPLVRRSRRVPAGGGGSTAATTAAPAVGAPEQRQQHQQHQASLPQQQQQQQQQDVQQTPQHQEPWQQQQQQQQQQPPQRKWLASGPRRVRPGRAAAGAAAKAG